MADKYGIDDKTRFLVLYLDAHMTNTEISNIIGRHSRTIQDWSTATRKGEDIRAPKKGRRKLIQEDIENTVIQMVKDNPEGITTVKLASRLGISRYSVGKILAKKGFKYLGYDRTVVYEEEERMIRVDFCNYMLSNEGKLIYQSFFSDEMGIQLNNPRRRAWQVPTKKIRRKSATDNLKMQCWGAISARGATSLEIYKSGMNGEYFRKTIEQHKPEMEALYPDGEFYFIQDNLSAHRMNEDWLIKKQKMRLIKWPRRSPDLNIIENLWSALKKRVRDDAPKTEKDLKVSLLKNWEILTNPERLQLCFEALHRRYIECVAIGGNKLPG